MSKRSIRNARIALAHCNTLKRAWNQQKQRVREAFIEFEQATALYDSSLNGPGQLPNDPKNHPRDVSNRAILWFRQQAELQKLHAKYRKAVTEHPNYCRRCNCIHGIDGNHDFIYHMKYWGEPPDPKPPEQFTVVQGAKQ